MRFVTDYPVRSDVNGVWIKPETIRLVCARVEAAGFDALAATDHPAPSLKWLQSGGHESFDPFALLSFMAAVTSRVSLWTHLLVVPYRNPILQLSGMRTLDALSGGRTIFVLGTGHLRSEFAAVGVDFDERNALFDEAISVIKQASAGDEISFEGLHFNAVSQTQPSFVQKPHPPLWLGGNSSRVLDRIAEWGEGWSVMMGPAELSTTARTRAISTIEDLRSTIEDLSRRLEAHGRSLSDISIQASTRSLRTGTSSTEEMLDEIGELAELGVSWVAHDPWTESLAESLDRMQKFSEEVIANSD